MQDTTNLKTLISEVEKDLLLQIILSLKHKEISVGEARRLAQTYLALLPISSKEELIEKMNVLGNKYPEARVVYLKHTVPYLNQKENKLITQMSQYLQSGNIEEAIKIAKVEKTKSIDGAQLPKIKSTQKASTSDRATGNEPAEKILSFTKAGRGIHATLEELVSGGIPGLEEPTKSPNLEQSKESKADPDKEDSEQTKTNKSQEVLNKLFQNPEYQKIFGELYGKARVEGKEINVDQISKDAQDQYYKNRLKSRARMDDQLEIIIKDVENDLLTIIINNLKQNNISNNEAKKLAQEFLSLLPMQDKPDLVEKLHKLSTNHTQVEELYLKYAKSYEDTLAPAKGGTPNA